MSFIIRNKLLYLATPITASRATRKVLQRAYPQGSYTQTHHMQDNEVKRAIKIYKPKIIFTTIRDPLDLIISWFLDKRKPHDFNLLDFIKKANWNNLERKGRLFYFLKFTTMYIKYERLAFRLATLLKKKIRLPKVGPTKDKKDFMNYHTDATIKAVWNRWPKDMEMYYTKGDIL